VETAVSRHIIEQTGADQITKTSKRLSQRWRIGIGVVIALFAAAAIAILYRMRGTGFRWDLFLATFRELDAFWMTAAILLILLTYVGRALRWQVLMRPVCPHPSFSNLLTATIIGFTAVVLFGRAGEVVRPYLIAIKEKVSFSSQLAAWLLERIYDLLVVLLISAFALTQIQENNAAFGPGVQWVLRTGGLLISVICTICFVVLMLFRQFSDAMRQRLLDSLAFLPPKYFHKIEQIVTAFAQGMQSTRSGSFVALLVFYTIAEWLVITASQVCLFKAVPITAHLRPIDSLIFVGFVAFGSIVQIPGVGGGMQVAAVLVLTEFFGLPFEKASGLAILIWITTYVVIIPFGFLLAFREGIQWNNLRHIQTETEPSEIEQ
jgi:uncharacterized protein (TIRG00374 family)